MTIRTLGKQDRKCKGSEARPMPGISRGKKQGRLCGWNSVNEEQMEKEEVFQEVEGLVTSHGKNSYEKNHLTVEPQSLLTRAVCKTHKQP